MVFQVSSLEQDALTVLRLVRSIKNSFAPVNRVPPEVLSLITDYYRKDGIADRNLLALTQVCRRWRDIHISRSLLWTRLDFKNIDKTLAYIQRSRSSALNLYLVEGEATDDAFALVIPHIRRLKSLTIKGTRLPSVLRHFSCHAPLLKKLDIKIRPGFGAVLVPTLFYGDLPSLHTLRIGGAITHFPWKNLANLQVVELARHSPNAYRITQLLDFFESAPLLHTVELIHWQPFSSDAPPERIVPLRCLKVLTATTGSRPSILLHHLHIPAGASLILRTNSGGECPLTNYLQKSPRNFSNLSHITAINLLFDDVRTYLLLRGPSGSFSICYPWSEQAFPSLEPVLSTTRRLMITYRDSPGPAELEDCPIFRTLMSTNQLRTLVLIDCYDLVPFTRALDPGRDPSNLVLCPNIEELVLYVEDWSPSNVRHLIGMAKNRCFRGRKLSLIKFVDLDFCKSQYDVLSLREHVTDVYYCLGVTRPSWDHIPAGIDGGG